MPLICFVTCANPAEAKKIAMQLLEKKIAVCANIMPAMESYYRWKGKIENGNETLLILKTKKGWKERIIKEVKELHSYELPVMEFFDAVSDRDVVKWIEEETTERHSLKK